MSLRGGVPAELYPVAIQKKSSDVFDAGSFVAYAELDEPGQQTRLVATRDIAKHGDVFLVDHLWSFVPPAAKAVAAVVGSVDEEEGTHSLDVLRAQQRRQLLSQPSLCDRLAAILDIAPPSPPKAISTEAQDALVVEEVLAKLWQVTASYTVSDGEEIMYVMDEVGSRIQPYLGRQDGEHERGPNLGMGVLFDPGSGECFNVFWPCRDIQKGEPLTSAMLPNQRFAHESLCRTLEPIASLSPSSGLLSDGGGLPLSEVLGGLGNTLLRAGYTVRTMGRALGLQVDGAAGFSLQNVTGSLRDKALALLSSAAQSGEVSPELLALVQLFMFGLKLPLSRVNGLLGSASLAALFRLGVLVSEDGSGQQQKPPSKVEVEVAVTSTLQLCPLGADVIIATDPAHVTYSTHGFEPVMHIGVDSLGLVALSEGEEEGRLPGRGLDLCCGSGVQGIAALKGGVCSSVDLVDLSPRATRFSKFNALLNGMGHAARVLQGDLFGPLEAEAVYDVILGNPPYIPSAPSAGAQGAADLELYGDGGSSGEHVTERIIRGAAQRLTAGGSLRLESIRRTGQHFRSLFSSDMLHYLQVCNVIDPELHERKLPLWWAEGHEGARFLVSYGRVWQTSEYAELVFPGGKERSGDYGKALASAGIKGIANGFILGRKAGPAGSSLADGEAQRPSRPLAGPSAGADGDGVEGMGGAEVQVQVQAAFAGDLWQALAMPAAVLSEADREEKLPILRASYLPYL